MRQYPKFIVFFSLLILLSTWKINAQESGPSSMPLEVLLDELQQVYDVSFVYEAGSPEKEFIPNTEVRLEMGLHYYFDLIRDNTPFVVEPLSRYSYVLQRKPPKALISGIVTDSYGRPLVGATIQVAPGGVGYITNNVGEFSFELAPGNWVLDVRYLGMKPQKKKLRLSGGEREHCTFSLEQFTQLEEIVVVGSPFGNTSLLDKIDPAFIINPAESPSRFSVGVSDILSYNLPSFNITPQTIADGTDHIAPSSLRSLGPDQMLVLINGKRRHQSSLVNINGTMGRGSVATDLSIIPIDAIEKVEVLKDGASVFYGSDAIAGVINIRLKENTNSGVLNAKMGLTGSGDGLTYDLSSNTSLSLGKNGGFANITASFLSKNAINRSEAYTGTIFGDERDDDPEAVASFFSNTGFDKRRVMSVGAAAMQVFSTFCNLSIPVRKNFEFYSFGGASAKSGVSSGFYRFPFEDQKQSGIHEYGFAPRLHSLIKDASLVSGISHKHREWTFDLSNSIAGNFVDFSVQNSNNASRGLASPSRALVGGFTSVKNNVNFDVTRKARQVDAFPVSFGTGALIQFEQFHQQSGEEVSWKDYQYVFEDSIPREGGIQMFPGFKPENRIRRNRVNIGVYTVFETAIKSWLKLNGGVRAEVSSDFGPNLGWKVSTRVRINPQHSIKAGVNTGFRSPSLPQLYYSSESTQYISQNSSQTDYLVGTFNNSSEVAQSFGIEKLTPEKSINFNLSYLGKVGERFSIFTDAYLIQISDRIVLSGKLRAEDDPLFAEVLLPLNVSSAQFFLNAIGTSTYGLDIGGSYSLPFSRFRLNFSLAHKTSKTKVATGKDGLPEISVSPLLEGKEQLLFNREEVAYIEQSQPDHKTIFKVEMASQKFKVSLQFTRFGPLEYLHPQDGNPDNWVLNSLTGEAQSRDQIFSAKTVCDFSLEYLVSDLFAVQLGANNLFNVFPDRHQHSANINNGIFPYSRRLQQFGTAGGFYFIGIGIKI